MPGSETSAGTGLASVDRALRLLEELARGGDLGATELALRLGAAKATAFRLARTLQARGYVVQNPDATYRLGPRCMLLATGVHASLDMRRAVLPALEALHEATEETVQLSVLDGREVVYVEQLLSRKPVRSVGELGSRAPAHCVSGGLAQLAHLDRDGLERFLAPGLERYTDRTVTSAAALRRELALVRARGWAINEGRYRREVGGVSAAVLDMHGRAVAAINVCVPVYRLAELGSDWLGEHVLRAGDQAGGLLGASIGPRAPVVSV